MKHTVKYQIPLSTPLYQKATMDERFTREAIHKMVASLPISELEKVFKIRKVADMEDDSWTYESTLDTGKFNYNNTEANKKILLDLDFRELSKGVYKDMLSEKTISISPSVFNNTIGLLNHLIENLEG